MEELLRRARLTDLYAVALSPRAQRILRQSVDEDCSLAEIAEAEGISRQGVQDALRRACEELERMEAALHLAETLQKQDTLLESAERALQAGDTVTALQSIQTIQKLWEDTIGV